MGGARGLWGLIHAALLSTSLKGIPRILKSKAWALRTLWTLSTIGLFAIAVLLLKQTFDAYFAYPTVLETKEVRPATDFPVLSMCNLKPIHNVPPGAEDSMYNYQEQLEANISRWGLGGDNITMAQRTAVQELRSIVGYYSYIGVQRAVAYGMRLEDFVVECTVRGEVGHTNHKCTDVGSIELYPSSHYFNCFKLVIQPSMVRQIQPYAVSLILYLNSTDDFISHYHATGLNDLQEVGVKVLLQSRYQIEDVFRRGISLPPGYLSNVKVDFTDQHRLGKPYGDCISNTNELLYNRLGESILYSQEGCYSACIQKNITGSCGCLSPKTKAVFSPQDIKLPFCSGPLDFEERFRNVLCAFTEEEKASVRCHLKCHIQCHGFLVKSSVTLSRWPRLSQQLAFYNTVIRNKSFADQFSDYKKVNDEYTASGNVSEALSELQRLHLIEENFVKVDVVQEDVFMKRVSEKVKTTIPDVISSVGSLLNLYSGITLVVCVEILDLLYCLLCFCFCKQGGEQEEGEKKEALKPAKPTIDNSFSTQF